MRKKADITASISRTVGFFFLAQLVFTTGLCAAYRIRPSPLGLVTYILALAFIHIGLWIFLLIMHDHFVLLHTGGKLEHINAANRLTMVRISSIPSVALALILADSYPLLPVLIPFVALIFLTDLLDGAIARGRRQVTRIGKYLDSISDYAILIVVSVIMAYYGIIPDWFVILALFRLVFQWIGMGALLAYQGYVHAMATLLGKFAIFATMFLYGFEVLALAEQFSFLRPYAFIPEYGAAGILCLSLAEKILYLKKSFVEAKDARHAKLDKSG
ncbi:MAG: CDP-alcohol phosphatidyltransferase family protein [Spirochaetales bacterium]|jgi:phosphatidylglycerophosphate synthase|nr:CDP-alcohol phosphatidyltransferase family protein [Spirochaetales bacterium]